jgi:hypothetical protein
MFASMRGMSEVQAAFRPHQVSEIGPARAESL